MQHFLIDVESVVKLYWDKLPFYVKFPLVARDVWDAREMGLIADEIAPLVGLKPRTVHHYIAEMGGIRPQAWKNPTRVLSYQERWRIKELLTDGHSMRSIAAQLGRAPSTISRELKRGGYRTTPRQYRPNLAQQITFLARRRPKPFKILTNPMLLSVVQGWLDEKYSPEQIVGRLQRLFPDEVGMRVSHETIYRTIYLQARGGLKRDLRALTRTGRTYRRPQRKPESRRGRMKEMVSIWDRPSEALERKVPGHWEGDLIVGKNGTSAIGTVVERFSNYVFLVKLDPTLDRPTSLAQGLMPKLAQLPETLQRSLTWDQGKEMAKHRQITIDSGVQIYFADPHSPWQRATNENTNGLLRQYFPKGTDLSVYSQLDLDLVADELNRRPRKRLQFATPYETLEEYLLQ